MSFERELELELKLELKLKLLALGITYYDWREAAKTHHDHNNDENFDEMFRTSRSYVEACNTLINLIDGNKISVKDLKEMSLTIVDETVINHFLNKYTEKCSRG